MADEFKESVESVKELRVVEHMQTITEYVEQVPILRIPAQTCRAVTMQMMQEYNEKFFPEEAKGKPGEGKKEPEKK